MSERQIALGESRTRIGEDEFDAIARLFEPNTFTGQWAREAATDTARNQPNLNRSVLARLTQVLQRLPENLRISIHDGLMSFERNQVQPYVESANFEVIEFENGYRVVSERGFPALTSDQVEEFADAISRFMKKTTARVYLLDLVALVIAGYARAGRHSGFFVDATQIPYITGAIAIAGQRLETYEILSGKPAEFLGQFGAVDAVLGELSAKVSKQFEQAASITEKIYALPIQNEQNSKYGDEFAARVEEMEGQTESFKRSIEERLKLNEARTLWKDTAKNSAIWFGITAAILAAGFIGIPIFAFIYRMDVVEFLKGMEAAMIVGASGDNTVASTIGVVGRLLIISAPLGFLVWFFRFLMRINVRSMLLMDDAHQRVTMLNTYLYLIEQDAAVKQDRGAILEALFRRAPGHGGDTVEPPHFTELLKYGQEKSI